MPAQQRDYIDADALARIWTVAPVDAGTAIPPPRIALSQTRHRLALLSHWSSAAISLGSRVLEIGCGQGDMTACLAAAVGPRGHVTALDPARTDYGSPLTLAQGQGLVCASAAGKGVVEFRRADAETFAVEYIGERFDAVVLAKSAWYFESREVLLRTLRAAASLGRRVCIAEYALSTTEAAGRPHVMASMAQGALYAAWVQAGGVPEEFLGGSNVRLLLGPVGLVAVAREAGLKLVSQEVEKSSQDEDLLDGQWDAANMVAKFASLEGDELWEGKGSAQIGLDLARTMRDTTLQEILRRGQDGPEKEEKKKLQLGMQSLRTMDVWVAEFGVGDCDVVL